MRRPTLSRYHRAWIVTVLLGALALVLGSVRLLTAVGVAFVTLGGLGAAVLA